ncbi:hypothetical protein J1614_008145 [Plenodomus biglobosus]|nr:hypothetical protein J1614_008145 [Plenodomus biglobosus]
MTLMQNDRESKHRPTSEVRKCDRARHKHYALIGLVAQPSSIFSSDNIPGRGYHRLKPTVTHEKML